MACMPGLEKNEMIKEWHYAVLEENYQFLGGWGLFYIKGTPLFESFQ